MQGYLRQLRLPAEHALRHVPPVGPLCYCALRSRPPILHGLHTLLHVEERPQACPSGDCSLDGLPGRPKRSLDGLPGHPKRSLDGLPGRPKRSLDGIVGLPKHSLDGPISSPQSSLHGIRGITVRGAGIQRLNFGPGHTRTGPAYAVYMSGPACTPWGLAMHRDAGTDSSTPNQGHMCGADDPSIHAQAPPWLLDPITHTLMRDPVLAGDGRFYDLGALRHAYGNTPGSEDSTDASSIAFRSRHARAEVGRWLLGVANKKGKGMMGALVCSRVGGGVNKAPACHPNGAATPRIPMAHHHGIPVMGLASTKYICQYDHRLEASPLAMQSLPGQGRCHRCGKVARTDAGLFDIPKLMDGLTEHLLGANSTLEVETGGESKIKMKIPNPSFYFPKARVGEGLKLGAHATVLVTRPRAARPMMVAVYACPPSSRRPMTLLPSLTPGEFPRRVRTLPKAHEARGLVQEGRGPGDPKEQTVGERHRDQGQGRSIRTLLGPAGGSDIDALHRAGWFTWYEESRGL